MKIKVSWFAALIAMMALVSIFGSASPSYALWHTSSAGTSGSQSSFDVLKSAVLKVIDASLARLNSTEGKIESNTYISPETQKIIIDSLNKRESALTAYKTRVEQASTLAELQAINQEVIRYLKDNKDIIRNNVQQTVIDIALQGLKKAEEFVAEAEELLKIAKLACPQEEETIAALETQLAELEAEIDLLEAAISAKNTSAIKQDVKDIAKLMQNMIPNLKKLESCVPGS